MKKGLLALVLLGSLVGCSSDGRLSLTWTITIDGANADCAAVGASQVEVISTLQGTSAGTSDLFTCSRFSGTTGPLSPGDYTVVVKLEDAGGGVISSVPPVNATVFSGDTTNAGHFVFPFVNPKATFTVHMGSAIVTGGNCNPTNPGNGAGVALEQIDIRKGTQCIAATISNITNENNQAITKPTCAPFICQENATQHVVTGLAPGNYTISVYGFKGATGPTPALCYISSAMPFTIGSSDVNIGQIFAPFDDSMDTQHLCNATKPGE
jgi:hypothetical protein